MTILLKNKHTVRFDSFKLSAVLEKMGLPNSKKRAILKHLKEPSKLNIYILEKIELKNHLLNLNVSK